MSNAPPLIPTNLTPPNGGTIVASIDNAFSWTFNDTGDVQSAYLIEYAQNIDGATIQNTGWVLTPSTQHVFPVGTFITGNEYKWRVKTKDSINQESPFSEWVVFKATPQISLDIIYPATDYEKITSMPTYQHSYSGTQSRYQYQVYNITTWADLEMLSWKDINNMTWFQLESFADILLWDSGIIWGSGNSITQPPGYLVGNKTYKVLLNVWDSLSELKQATRYFILNFNAPPTPIITATTDPDKGTATFVLTNPNPLPGQPTAAYNNIYRRREDFTWILEKTGVIGNYTVPVFASGTRLVYAATAVAADGSESARSIPVDVTITFNDYWITDPDTGETFKLRAGIAWGQMQSQRHRKEIWGIDEKYPSVMYDQYRYYHGTFQAAVTEETGIPREQAEAFRSFVDGITKKPMLFKTPFGDVFLVDISNVKIKPTIYDPYRVISFDITEVAPTTNVPISDYEVPPNPPDGYWIVDPDTGKGVKFFIDPDFDMLTERGRHEAVGLMNKYPDIDYSKKRAIRSSFTGWIVSDDISNSLIKVRELLDAPTKKPLRFLSPFGDDLLVDIYDFSFSLLLDRIGNVRRISFSFVEVGEVESIL